MTALKILIIEDNDADRMLLEYQIDRLDQDVEIFFALNGEDALSKIRSNDYGLIFLDYILPDMDGLDVLKSIYDAENDLAPCPVIMLAGQSRKDVMLDAIQYGAQDYITKDDISVDVLNVTLLKAQHGYNLRLKHREATQQLAEALRIEALGKLTGGVAHDFNNLLTIITGNVKLCELALNDASADAQDINDGIQSIKDAAQRGANLVKQLMVFARNEYLEPQRVDPNAGILDVQEILEQSIKDNDNVEFSLQDGVWDVHVDPTQFEAMIINLVTNARDAMPDGGTITISSENINTDHGQFKGLEDYEIPNECVLIKVADTGEGIKNATLNRVFEPFFTTKKFGKGTGLGLSMVYGFVKSSDGFITIDSEIGKGSQFNILLPKFGTGAPD